MQKLLEETLIGDQTLQIEPYEYGEKWSNIENHLKRIITKDNHINTKNNHKKLVLNLSKTNTLTNDFDKMSPKQLKDSMKSSTNSIYQNFTQKRNIVGSINSPKNSKMQNDFIKQQQKYQQSKPQSNKTQTYLSVNQQQDFPKNQSQGKSVNFNPKILQIKNQQRTTDLKNQQLITSIKIQKPFDFKTQPYNVKISSFQSLGQDLCAQTENHNKKTDKQNYHLSFLKNNKQNNYNSSQWHKYQKNNQFETSNIENNLKIERLKTSGIYGISSDLQKQPKNRLNNKRAKTEHKYLQIKNVHILLDNKKENQLKRPSENQNYKLIKSLEDYKNEINQLKTHVLYKQKTADQKNYKKSRINNDFSKLYHQKSIVFPLIERSGSENKMRKQRILTTRDKQAYTFSQSRDLSEQKAKSNLKKQMTLSADKLRVQSIKLVVKKQKPSDQSLVSKQMFQEIDLQNKQQQVAIRKLKISQFKTGKFDLNESVHFKQNRNFLALNRNRNSKSCFMKNKQIASSPLNVDKKSQQQSQKRINQFFKKRQIFYSNKDMNAVQKKANHSNQKQRYSKQKLQRAGKENQNKKISKKDEKNMSVLKIQLNKHQPKLIIVKK